MSEVNRRFFESLMSDERKARLLTGLLSLAVHFFAPEWLHCVTGWC